MLKTWLYPILLILAVIGAACGVQPAESSPQTTAAAVEADNTLLLWEGPALFAEDATECHHLRVTHDDQALIGPCAGEQTEAEFVSNNEGGLAGMVARFAPFQADTSQGRITFNGEGGIAGPAWERAITSWAQVTYAELAAGHIGAANRTVLAWKAGEQAGQCQMLVVLAHGYATASLTPCAGGQMEVLASGWVDPAAWEQFDTWLYNRAPLYQDNSYLDGRGTTEMSAEETAALAEWAKAVYAKLSQTGSTSDEASLQAITPPAVCPTPNDDQRLLLSQENGYCLLYPAEYTLAQPNPDSIEIVKDSIMNHIDPRVSVQVAEAAGRNLDEAARQLEADYVPAGFTVERSPITVDGVEAVMFDNLPGQDLNRRVIFIQNERLYSLFIAPIGDAGSEVRQQAEALSRLVLDSFRFVEPAAGER